MAETIVVTGLKETRAKFKQIDKQLDKELITDLKNATAPVVDAARAKIARFAGASIRTIRPRIAGRSAVVVRQHAKKVTGKRGDYGALEAIRLSDALSENREEVVESVRRAVVRVIS